MTQVDRARLEAAIAELLRSFGQDPETSAELRKTPARAADMFEELFGGLQIDPRTLLADPLPDDHEEMIAVRDLSIRSMCEHHLVPMVGTAHVAYIPDGRIVGFDRIARVVDAYARRPQVQERLTVQVADVIDEILHPHGVGVMLRLEQMCMTIRGVRQTESRTVTTAWRGRFRTEPALRAEFLALVQESVHTE